MMMGNQPLRRDLVEMAVKFLVTVGVHDGRAEEVPADDKIKFLKDKGLTDAEIREAQRMAVTMKPTQADRDVATLASEEAQKATDKGNSSPSSSSVSPSNTPTVVYVTPPAASASESGSQHANSSGSWSHFLSTSVLSAAFAVGLSSIARTMEWSRNIVDPGAKEREEADQRYREELKVQADKNEALLRQQQQSAQSGGARSLELQGLRREVERLQRSVQRQATEAREEVKQLQAEVRAVRKAASTDASALSVSADIRSELASIKTLMLTGSSLRASDRSLSGLNFSANNTLTDSSDKAGPAKGDVQAPPVDDEDDLDSSANFSNASPIAMASRSPMTASPDSSNKPNLDATKGRAALENNAQLDNAGEPNSGRPETSADETRNVGPQAVSSPVATEPTKRSLLDTALQDMFDSTAFEVFKKGHKTILLILSNLKREPNNPRFAKIAMTNATFSSALAPIDKLDGVFKALEFENRNNCWHWQPNDRQECLPLLAAAISSIREFVAADGVGSRNPRPHDVSAAIAAGAASASAAIDQLQQQLTEQQAVLAEEQQAQPKQRSPLRRQPSMPTQPATPVQSIHRFNQPGSPHVDNQSRALATSNAGKDVQLEWQQSKTGVQELAQPFNGAGITDNFQPPMSLAQVVEAQQKGIQLPGIRTIPDTLSQHPSSVGQQAAPPKPWAAKPSLSGAASPTLRDAKLDTAISGVSKSTSPPRSAVDPD